MKLDILYNCSTRTISDEEYNSDCWFAEKEVAEIERDADYWQELETESRKSKTTNAQALAIFGDDAVSMFHDKIKEHSDDIRLIQDNKKEFVIEWKGKVPNWQIELGTEKLDAEIQHFEKEITKFSRLLSEAGHPLKSFKTSESFIDYKEIRDTKKCEEVFERYGTATRNPLVFRCPKHDDKRPSLSISRVKNRFMCFQCGWNGSCIDAVMFFENCDFKTALKILNDW